MFWLNRNKQKTNRNCLIGSIFCYFYRKFRVFPFFFVFFFFFGLFWNSLFRFRYMIVYLILYGHICSNIVRYDRVCDLICDRFSVVQRFCCSEVQLFRVPEVQSFPGFPRFPSLQSSVGSMPSKCWSVRFCLFLRLCLSGREGSCLSTL
jgi:hypothetical protein